MKRMQQIGIWFVCLVGLVLVLLRLLWCALFDHERAEKIGAGISRAGNAALNGDPRETISSRAHHSRSRERKWACRLCRLLDRLDPNHCRDAADEHAKHTSTESQP